MNLSINQSFASTLPKSNVMFKPAYHYTTLVLSLLIVLLNASVVELFRLHRVLFQRPCNRPLLSLAVADLLTGVNTLLQLVPFFEFHYSKTTYAFSLKYLIPLNMLTTFLSLVSIFHLCFLAIDRYAAIFRAFTYEALVTKQKMDKVIVMMWMCALALTAIQLIWNHKLLYNTVSAEDKKAVHKIEIVYSATATILFAFSPTIALGVVYYKLFCVSRMLIRKDPNTTVDLHMKRKRERKHLITYIIMYLCFTILCLPYFIVRFVADIDVSVLKHAPTELIEALYMLRTLVSLANPIIYCLLRRDIYKLLQITLQKKFPSRSRMSRCETLPSCECPLEVVKGKTCGKRFCMMNSESPNGCDVTNV